MPPKSLEHLPCAAHAVEDHANTFGVRKQFESGIGSLLTEADFPL
jgi:hypothetical protein